MRLSKKINKATKHLTNMLEDMGSSTNLTQDETKYIDNSIVPVLNRYVTCREFVKYKTNDILKTGLRRDRLCYCLDNVDTIINYKLKMAKGKLNNNPKQKAIIDLSEQLAEYANKYVDCGGAINLTETRQAITIESIYTNKICLPFDNCFIYTHIENVVSQVLDIKHDLKGGYTGSLYLFFPTGHTIQMSINIVRKDMNWLMTATMPLFQKPLGISNPNIITLLDFYIRHHQGIEEHYKNVYTTNAPITQKIVADMLTGVLSVFEILGSYKSKYMYKVSNEDRIVYLYTTAKEVSEYMKKHYDKFDYELQNQWLINGYWKFLKPNEIGRTKEGKPIAGMDWIVPYKDELTNLQVNGQQTNMVKIHAIQRAKERYNLDLTTEDLTDILKLCFKSGKKLSVRDKFGIIKSVKGKTGPYRISYKNMVIDVSIDRSPMDKSYRIATFLPKPKDIKTMIIDCKNYKIISKNAQI